MPQSRSEGRGKFAFICCVFVLLHQASAFALRMSSEKVGKLSEVDVAIIGGGIGGLATALAFRRLTNITAKVFERSPTLRGGEGTALTMWPNGLSALGAIDPELLKRVKASGSVIRRQTFMSQNASRTEDTGVLEKEYGEPLLSVFWRRLHSQLAEAVGPDCIELGTNCRDVEETEDGVVLKFEDGRQVKAACVLAADGIHSVIRRKLINDGRPQEHGRWIYRSVVHHAPGDPAPDRDEMMGRINTDPSKLIHWQPCGELNTYWAVVKRSKEGEAYKTRGDDPAAMKQWLLEEFAEFPEILGMISATDPADILERPVLDRPPVERWAFGRTLLIGDAAHAMILSVGQGANTALEDAVYIASYLRDARAMFPDKARAVAEAFRCFQKVRIPHCTQIQMESQGYAKNAYGSERKLGGYRLVKFNLLPFATVHKELALQSDH